MPADVPHAVSDGPPNAETNSVSVERLAKVELLSGLDRGLLGRVATDGELRRASPGEVIVGAGQLNDRLHIVLEGSLQVHLGAPDDGEPVARIDVGQVAGELSLLDRSPTCAFVVASEPSELLVVDEDLFWELTRASHDFCFSLLLRLVQVLRNNNATVEQSTRERREAEQVAFFDGLTGIPNRRWLEDTFEQLRRDRAKVAVAVLDVDHFKRFNDTYGHLAGDEVLCAVASAVSDHLRPSDHVARWGGEEFVVLLMDTDVHGARSAADRLREVVSHIQVETPCGKSLPSVTVSIGVAEWDGIEGFDKTICAADEALYEAKRSGRDRVCMAKRDKLRVA